ncbi:MAG: virulence factor MviN, partial [Burkholderiaceae bacterium]
MFLQAGAVSLSLLLASRVLGLLRESALAAAFGTSGQADVAVLMFTLPDLVAGLFATGALAYVLLPHWGAAGAASIAATQRRLGRFLLAAGAALGLGIAGFAVPLAAWLAGGLPETLLRTAAEGLRWSALAVPAA